MVIRTTEQAEPTAHLGKQSNERLEEGSEREEKNLEEKS